MNTDTKVWDWRGYILKYAPDNATYKHLLLTLSCYMNSAGGSCFPSISELQRSSSLSRPTIIKYLKKATSDGWIKIHKKKSNNNEYDRNTYTADIPNKVVKEINYLVKEVNQGSKTDEGGVVKEVNSNTPINNSSDNSSLYPFDDFWDLYDKKKERSKCEKKWNRLSEKEKSKAMEFIPIYKNSLSDLKYQKYPSTFLNNKLWQDDWSEYKDSVPKQVIHGNKLRGL